MTHSTDTFPTPTDPATRTRSEHTARFIRLRGADGLSLAADEWGDRSGHTVLLLHGGGQTRHSWKAAGRALATYGLHVVNLDLRGHGESDWSPDHRYGVEPCRDDVLAVLEQVGTPVVLVGASLGGLTSLMVIDAVPELITALVLVDIVVKMEGPGIERILTFLTAAPDGFATLDEAADAVAAYLPHRPRPGDSTGLRKNLRQHANGRWYWHWDPGWFSPEARAATVGIIDRLDACARRVSAPTLLVHGMQSDVVSQDGVDHFRGLVPHAQVVELSDAAHTAAADDNDAFVAAVVDMCRAQLVKTVVQPAAPTAGKPSTMDPGSNEPHTTEQPTRERPTTEPPTTAPPTTEPSSTDPAVSPRAEGPPR